MKHASLLFLFIFIAFTQYSCKDSEPKPTEPVVLDYKEIVETVRHDSTIDMSDTANILDKNSFDPNDSLNIVLDSLEKIFANDSSLVKKSGINDSGVLASNSSNDGVSNPKDSFSNNIKKINVDEIKSLKYNLEQLHNKDSNASKALANTSCKQSQCRVWARVNKTDQRLYLYIDGKIVDTFKVSTGDTKHETPTMDRRPAGPIFQKYTSKKYPGGNYNGLGNMPYVVFVSGGYGIHGTTKGNIPKLGKKASHGCVRLHPENAKILNELVRKAGLENTWITIEK